jgi:hypothetical protein
MWWRIETSSSELTRGIVMMKTDTLNPTTYMPRLNALSVSAGIISLGSYTLDGIVANNRTNSACVLCRNWLGHFHI